MIPRSSQVAVLTWRRLRVAIATTLPNLTNTTMLSLPIQRRHLRSTAVLTLLAWVLALLAGMVNACQLQTYTPGTHTPVVSVHDRSGESGADAEQAFHVNDGDHDAVGGHEGPSNTGMAGCLKFCADESSTVAKGETTQHDLLGMVMLVSIDWQPAMPFATATQWRSVDRLVSRGPPLFIRFQRLTI